MTARHEQPRERFVIGTDEWPGVAKLIEECNELGTALAKLMAFPNAQHPDGAGNTLDRVLEEIADVRAAARFFLSANDPVIHESWTFGGLRDREDDKFIRFVGWHRGA